LQDKTPFGVFLQENHSFGAQRRFGQRGKPSLEKRTLKRVSFS
jgi:hypothetical protein